MSMIIGTPFTCWFSVSWEGGGGFQTYPWTPLGGSNPKTPVLSLLLNFWRRQRPLPLWCWDWRVARDEPHFESGFISAASK